MTNDQATAEISTILNALVERCNPLTVAEACSDVLETVAALCGQAVRHGPNYTCRLASLLRAAQGPLWAAMMAPATHHGGMLIGRLGEPLRGASEAGSDLWNEYHEDVP